MSEDPLGVQRCWGVAGEGLEAQASSWKEKKRKRIEEGDQMCIPLGRPDRTRGKGAQSPKQEGGRSI